MPALKTLAQLLAAVLAAIIPGLAVDALDAVGWFNVIALAAGAVYVYLSSNDIPGWSHVKTAVSAVAALCVALMSFWSGGVTPAEWTQIGLAVLGALGVYALPNKTSSGPLGHLGG